MFTMLRSVPCERVWEPVEIHGCEYQVWSDPAVMGLDRFYVTRDGKTVECRLLREEAAHYPWAMQWPPGMLPPSTSESSWDSGIACR